MRSAHLLVALVALGCSSSPAPPPPRTDAGDAVADTQTLREANAAAGEVVRHVGDCDAVKAAAPEALRKLDQIALRVRTGAGRTSLLALRKQVTDADEICP